MSMKNQNPVPPDDATMISNTPSTPSLDTTNTPTTVSAVPSSGTPATPSSTGTAPQSSIPTRGPSPVYPNVHLDGQTHVAVPTQVFQRMSHLLRTLEEETTTAAHWASAELRHLFGSY